MIKIKGVTSVSGHGAGRDPQEARGSPKGHPKMKLSSIM